MKVDMRKEIAVRVYRALLLQGIKKMGDWSLTENKEGIVDPGGKIYQFKGDKK